MINLSARHSSDAEVTKNAFLKIRVRQLEMEFREKSYLVRLNSLR
jgi:hypothetical protein